MVQRIAEEMRALQEVFLRTQVQFTQMRRTIHLMNSSNWWKRGKKQLNRRLPFGLGQFIKAGAHGQDGHGYDGPGGMGAGGVTSPSNGLDNEALLHGVVKVCALCVCPCLRVSTHSVCNC